jgi:hypothetical protein
LVNHNLQICWLTLQTSTTLKHKLQVGLIDFTKKQQHSHIMFNLLWLNLPHHNKIKAGVQFMLILFTEIQSNAQLFYILYTFKFAQLNICVYWFICVGVVVLSCCTHPHILLNNTNRFPTNENVYIWWIHNTNNIFLETETFIMISPFNKQW